MDKFNFQSPQPDLLSLVIPGDRIRLVTIDSRFEREIFQEFTDKVTTYMIPSSTKNIEETRNFISASREGIKAGYNLQFVIVSEITGEFLVNCGLHGENSVKTPEIGIWLKEDAHGKGYGREAVYTLVNWTKNNLDLDYLVYPVDRRNVPSRKIPESLGGKIIQEYKMEISPKKVLDLVKYKIPRTTMNIT